MKKMTQDEVIARAKLHHGDFYDYSSINYINQSYKIDVTCPIHGVFSKWPKDFINGSGCKKCGDAAAAKKRADTTETFIKKAQNTHVIYIHIMRLTTQITILKLKYIVPYMGLFGKNLGFIPVDIIVLTAQAAVLNL